MVVTSCMLPLAHRGCQKRPRGAKAPIVLGNEGSGIVEESGRFKPGSRVAIYGAGELGITQDGLYQQWVLVEDKRILELPDTLDWDEGAALTVNYLTAYIGSPQEREYYVRSQSVWTQCGALQPSRYQ
jgi:NADPH2:quinone reductase